MPDTHRIVRQWLETEAAFGVAEVPVRHQRSAAPIGRTIQPVAAPIRPAMTPYAQTLRQPPPAVRPAPVQPQAPAAIPARPMAMPKKNADAPAARVVVPTPAGLIASLPPLSRAQKEQLLEQLRVTTEAQAKPYLSEISTRLVFGEGDAEAPLMFVGEGPGAEEDKTGRPFVGRSGQLLDKMIVAMGFQRSQIYIANVVKLRCAAPDELSGGRLKDRPPTPEEAARGLPILHQQIEIIRPQVIVTLGAPAIKHLTGTIEGVTKIRGTWFSYRGIPVMPTLHPSYLLRAYTEENRRKVWNDLKLALTKITGKTG